MRKMKDLIYQNKTIRMSEETWEKLNEERKKLNLSWNLFLLELLRRKLNE